MIFSNLTNVTTAAQPSVRKQEAWLGDMFLGVSGTGSVTIEYLGEDQVWRSWPQSVFTAPVAQIVTMKNSPYRFKVTGGPLTIETSL